MLTRRRFIEISAGAACALVAGRAGATVPVTRWSGIAMGAQASITLAHPDDAAAGRLVEAARAEIGRMEQIFSLYRSDSALSRLNRDGRLDVPPFDLVSLLSLADAVNRATGGTFDPTIQPLWRAYADHFARVGADPAGPAAEAVAAARARTGWRRVSFDEAGVRFALPGMALTLNGIAQGYATDRVADLLRSAGLRDVLVNVGEIRALGRRPDGAPWRIGLAERGDGAAEERIDATETAVATSAPLGTTLDPAGRLPHMIDPRTGRPGGLWRRVSVLGPSAAVADGLSTAFSLMPADDIRAGLARYPGFRVIAVDRAGVRLDASA